MKQAHPAQLTAAQRLNEIATLLAGAYWRQVANQHATENQAESTGNQLADRRRVEAPCSSHAMSLLRTEGAA